MIKYLLYAGLTICPFLTIPGHDQRADKLAFAAFLCLLVALYGLGRGFARPYPSVWPMLFIGWTFLATTFSPSFQINGQKLNAIWNYVPMFYMLVFFGASWAISNVCWSNGQMIRLFKMIAYSGAIMAFIVLLEAVGVSMFHVKHLTDFAGNAPAENLVGTLGHPTIAAQFILICIPFMFYLRRYALAVIMVIAMLMCKSNMALLAAVAGLIVWFSFQRKALCIVLLVGLAVMAWPAYLNGMASDSGRFILWSNIFKDMQANPYSFFTGMGIGSFQYLYPMFHPVHNAQNWYAAHNEFMDVLWGVGIPGLILMVKSLLWPIERAFEGANAREIKCLCAALAAMYVCASGNFIWHLGVFCLYGACFLGLLMALIRRKDVQLIK